MEKSVALITGGVGGIGLYLTKALAEEGYQVVAGCRPNSSNAERLAGELAQTHPGVTILPFDVADFGECQRVVLDIEETIGPITVLVNNAGITRDGTLKKMEPSQWRSVLDTNLDSVFNLSRAVLPRMLEREYGRIISISSINGQKGQFGQCNYAAAKAGMYGFTKSLAQEVAAKGITVNTISPGYIETDMIRAIDEGIRDKIRRQIPVQRFGQPEEIARAVAFLADKESGFITGSNLAINGGQYMA
ncbi:acetoacetyl-CoA reductase [Ferrimonas balearica]|uniref:acetoacetyl-CoA reductase n=1 Tax=Ferrimonas balearica TaxID=44012 RepID=UPI001C994DF6|nr:acetoacetyl-CoA reductase [Ferrimonas balearica]MBY5922560.1 acetoacetyl-CoA reductase [Ferrimonas balearica]MBY5995544.1 acetoacetyl-CoA reductase [Ferrimonas balearica]